MALARRALAIFRQVSNMPTSSLLRQISRGFATHGLSETGPKTSGLVRFYKQVSVKEAPGQVIKLPLFS
jgi:hypothetical protein